MRHLRLLVPIVAAALAPALSCADYLGMVKVPRSLVQQADRGIYSFSSSTQSPFLSGSGADSTHELKLGYKYSKFLSIEGQFNDFNRPQDPFSTRATIAPTFHGSGY